MSPNADPVRSGLSRADFVRLAIGAGAAAMTGLPAVPAAGAGVGAGAAMLRRAVPKTGARVPVVGFGTWQTFDVGEGEGDRAPRREVLKILFEAGGAVIDTSPMYGRAEAVVDDLLADLGARGSAFIATKVWTEGRQAGIAQMHASLAKLRAPRIELMQVHNLVDWAAHLDTLAGWKADGMIDHVGITHYTPQAFGRLAKVMRDRKIDFVQLPYSIEIRDAERTLLPLAADLGIAVIVNRPFSGGGLFRRAKGRRLPPWAAELGIESWAQYFLKYLLAHPAVTCVIPGTGRPDHARDNVAAGIGPMPDSGDQRRMLDHWRAA